MIPGLFTQDNTVGLLSYVPDQAFDGYNLLFPHNQPNVYLLNNCGEIVNVWEDASNFRPGNIAYLSEDGLLYKGKRDAAIANDPIWAGGGGAILEIRDWDNNLIWDFEMNDSLYRLHHDFAITPSGNIIALAWEFKSTEECIAAGRDTSTLTQGVLWPDWVLEIDPFNDTIVWEWHAWDHLVQDFDSTKANYGVIADHPELIDVNYGRLDGHPDWHHGNALDYNAELRQIMLSIPYFDEIWIIDHSTSTEEAAVHFGGLSNKGGDLMFRWGNPQTFDSGDSTDQKLFFQHDTHWIDDFLQPTHPHYGKIGVFNNRAGADYSTANIINAPIEMYDWVYFQQPDGSYFPEDFDLTIQHPEDSTRMYSTGLSSVQILPNGNTLICVGRFGYSFEVTPDNEIVWEYITPLRGGNPVAQGEQLSINNNLTFRLKRYPADHPMFADKDLSPKGYIELDPDTSYCAMLTSTMDLMDETAFKLYPNPTDGMLTIEWDGMVYADIQVFNMQGQSMARMHSSGGRVYFNVADWETGMYLVSIQYDGKFYSRRFVVD